MLPKPKRLAIKKGNLYKHLNIDLLVSLFKQLSLVLSATMKFQIQLTEDDYDESVDVALAPCVKVNGRLITQASTGDVVRAIRESLVRRRRLIRVVLFMRPDRSGSIDADRTILIRFYELEKRSWINWNEKRPECPR